MLKHVKTAIIVHGKGGSPTTSWLPWLQQQLEGQGIHCVVPVFPTQNDSKLADWFSVFQQLSVSDLGNTIIIAHARGAMAMLRWINTLPTTTRIRQIITVSCNFDYQPDRADGDEFYAQPLNYTDITNKCQNIVVVHSADDPYVPIRAGEELASNLHARLVRYQTAGHFGSDKLTAPEILREIGETSL